ncbi:hypothetical protein HYH02_011901 [Chlamydomonas schloesseri]|uniref:NAD(P)-binding domain-containing protein n=1 Tax=Chlamydomonas schloesseri TaxID=2026947 RepID=A0A835W1B2_9CHLO|nr:hypothetical protein HYH02_011901 [Chlamydomonas schloesseri]|eukprot:KAG2435610.1 hypothetical protein HYH02_011901 [Chlamydomonas schloesseri]
MALHATGPAATGTSRGASARASRSGFVSAPRSRRATPVRAAATETKAPEQPKGTVSIGALFGGLPKLGVTGTVQLGSKKKEEKKGPASKGGRDDSVVFVAGSTGRTGARVVRELLAAGFTVRAGARNVESAEAALNVAAAYGIIKPDQLKRVTVVPFDLEKPAEFDAAIGSANKIVCAVGAPEDQALNFSAPKKVDGDGTIALVNKASELGVNQFVLVSSLGTGKLGWPAGVLNLFGGVLLWKREAEKALEASGMAYTIVRPGGMERPTDDYKKTHNLTVKPRDTTFGGQVSRLQVAELVAAACTNPAVAENKVLELVAETTAPPTPLDALMEGITQDISRESQLSNREQVDAARAELAAAQVKASQAAAVLLEADKRVAELSARLKEAKATEAAVKKEVGPVLKNAAPLEKQLAEARKAAERAVLLEQASKVVLERARKAAGSGVLLSDKERAAIVDEVLNPKPAAPEKPAAAAEPKKGSGQIFGFFGKKPEPAGPTQEEIEAAEAAAKAEAEAAAAAAAAAAKAKAPASLFSFFTPKPAEPSAEERAAAAEAEAAAAAAAEAEAKAAAAAAAAAAKAKAPAPLFGGFFTPKPAEPEPEQEPEPEPVAPPPPPPPAAKKARAVPPPVAVKEEVVIVQEEVVVEEAKPAFSFGGFFSGLGKAIVAEPEPAAPAPAEPEPAKPEPPKAAEKPAAAPVEAAAPPPPPAPKPAPPPPAPKPAAPEVDPAVELARRRVVEAAKAKLAAEAAAAAAAAKPAAAAPPPPPPAPKPVAEPPKPVVAEAPKAEAPKAEAPKAEAPVAAKKSNDYDEAAAAKNKAEAKAWIDAWKAQSKAGAAKPAAAAAAAAAPVAAAAAGKEEVPANVAEARAWIAAWKERSGMGEQPAAAAEEAEVVVDENPVAKFFTNLFG